MKRLIPIASTVLLALGMQTARADIKVLACEPEWGALVKELAGDKASVYVATTGLQDPHRIEARPSLVAAATVTSMSPRLSSIRWASTSVPRMFFTALENPRVSHAQPAR